MGAEQRVLQQDNRALLHTVFSSSACMSWREESIPDSTWVHNSPTWNEPSVEQVVGFTTFLPMCWRASCWREGQVEAQFSSPLGNTGGYKVMQPGCSWGCFVGEADSDGVCETPALFSARSWCGAQQPAHVSCAHWTPFSLSFLPTTTEKPQDFSVWQTPLLTSLLGGNGMIKLMANRLIVTIWKECLPINKM